MGSERHCTVDPGGYVLVARHVHEPKLSSCQWAVVSRGVNLKALHLIIDSHYHPKKTQILLS
jgi:hypothetical protein